jgi:hypothetical protein
MGKSADYRIPFIQMGQRKNDSLYRFYNGLYFGCAVNATDISDLEIARAVLDVELKKKFYSSRLSKSECTINDKKVTFYISGRRTEVAYALPR